jgi:hypothetical protein
MITLPCTSCQRVLQIDDAFAGGVCRCQHCGTIQTVPAKSKSSGGAPSAKTLYQKYAGAGGQPDGAGNSGPTRAAQPNAPSSARRTVTIVVAGAILLVAVAVVIWLMVRPAA